MNVPNNMKRLFLLILLACASWSAQAQMYDPVSWKFSVEEIKGDEATVVLTATIENRWHVYSQFIEEGGPTLKCKLLGIKIRLPLNKR